MSKEVEEILKYIRKNFSMNYKENYLRLLEFMEENNYTINIEDANKLIENSIAIINMLENILLECDALQQNRLSILISAYKKKVNIGVNLNNNLLEMKDSYYNLEANKMYIKEAKTYRRLDAFEEYTLFQRMKNGDDEARILIIKHNLWLVLSCLKQDINENLQNVDDLIEEGNIALLKAVEKFDLSHGCRFSTYATRWIKKSINLTRMRHYIVKIPVEKISLMNKVKDIIDEYRSFSYEFPSIEELMFRTNATKEAIQTVIDLIKYYNVYSLDTPRDEDDDECLGDTIIDTATSVENQAIGNVEFERLYDNPRYNKFLTPKTKKIINIMIKKGYTQKEVAEYLNTDKQNINNPIVSARKKMLANLEMREYLSQFMEVSQMKL